MPKLDKEKLKELVEITDEMLEASKDQCERMAEIFADGRNYMLDNQLEDKVRGEGWAPVQINKMFPAIMQEIANNNARKMKIIARPWGEEDHEGASIVSEMLQWQYERGVKFEQIRMGATVDAKTAGIYCVKVYWDQYNCWDDKNKKWDGALQMRLIRPEFVGVDPDAESFDDAEFVFIKRAVPLNKAKKLYPKFKKELEERAKKNRKDIEMLQWVGSYDLDRMGYDGYAQDPEAGRSRQPTSARLVEAISGTNTNRTHYANPKSPDYVVLTEVYYRDYETKTVKVEQPFVDEDYPEGAIETRDGMPRIADPKFFAKHGIKAKKGEPLLMDKMPKKTVETREEPAYPYGRMIIRADDIILNPDTEDQRYPYKRWPLVVGVNLPLPHSPYGLNSVELGRGLQDLLNVIGSAMGSHAMLSGNPITLMEQGVDPTDPELKNVEANYPRTHGAIWKVAAGKMGSLKTMDPPQFPQGILAIFQEAARDLQDVMASPDVAIGRASSGEQSASEIAALAQAAATRQNLPGKLMDEWMIKVFELACEILKTHYKPGDWVRVVGEENDDTVVQLQQSDFDAKYDLKLEVTEAQPFTKQMEKQNLLAIAQMMGLASPTLMEKLLEVHEIDQKDQILTELQQAQQRQADAQAQQMESEERLRRYELAIKAKQAERSNQKGQSDGKN